MSIKISYSSNSIKKIKENLVLFSNDRFNLNTLKKYISKAEFTYINDILKHSDIKKKFICFQNKFKEKDNNNFN